MKSNKQKKNPKKTALNSTVANQSKLKKGDIVIRAYAHEPEEWGVVVELETVVVDPRKDDCFEDDVIEYIYATVFWPGYTTQEADYELWTPQEAIDYAIKHYSSMA